MTAASKRVLVALLVLAPISALAQSPQATELFKEGRDLMKAGHFVEACSKFAKSQDLDPQLGTLFNLAQCDEKIGKLATALAGYREVVAKDGNAKRKALAAEYQSKLEPRVPKLVVQVAKPPPSLVVTLDGPTGGKPIDANLPIEIDLGEYTVVARADGFRELSTKVQIDTEGETKTVPINLALVHGDETVSVPKPEKSPTPAPVEPQAEPSHRARNGKLALIGGGVLVAGGIVFGALAQGAWNDAQGVCGGTLCPTMAQVNTAEAHVDDARTYGNVSTGLVAGGAIVAALGVYLWLTAPSDEHAVRVGASSSNGTTTLTLGGHF
ncbi:MAG TPA: hypothetical protein VMJ10_20480 [Kofleriaceae bacterium]|nr:hypothetical protein [Kofleriaceae bacterium]